MVRRTPTLVVLVILACSLGAAQQPKALSIPGITPPDKSSPQDPLKTTIKQSDELAGRPPLTKNTRYELIKVINAEFVRTRKTLPLGAKNIKISPEGEVTPSEGELYEQALAKGSAAKVGDRVQITNIRFKDDAIVLDLNGGAKRKDHWYNHISIGMSNGNTSEDPNGNTGPTGSTLTLEFKKHVPEMTGPELEALLAPVLDFSVESATQVYLATLPPKVQEAIKNHEVLVGMNRDMVTLAKDRPNQRVREKDKEGREYEEWIYGTPPQDMYFVRFIGDEVTEVRIAKMGYPIVVKTQKEVDIKSGVASLASAQAGGSTQAGQEEQGSQTEPAYRPTLKRPGEGPDPALTPGAQPGSGQPTQPQDPDRDPSTPLPQTPQSQHPPLL